MMVSIAHSRYRTIGMTRVVVKSSPSARFTASGSLSVTAMGKRVSDSTTPYARQRSWSRSMPVAFQALRTTASPAISPSRITSGTAAVSASPMCPTIVPPVNGLFRVALVPSARSSRTDKSPRMPPVTPSAIPATSSAFSTRPNRDVTRPLGNRTFTRPWTATGSHCTVANRQPTCTSRPSAPSLRATNDCEATAIPTAVIAAQPESSQPNGRSGRRTTSNAPTTAYGTTYASVVAISATSSRGASASVSSAAIVTPNPASATASSTPAAGTGWVRGDQVLWGITVVVTMCQP